MDIKKVLLFNELIETVTLFKKNLVFIPIIAFLDMFFFIALGFFRQLISFKLIEKISLLQGIMQTAPSLQNITKANLVEAVASRMQFTQEYTSLYYLLLLMLVITFVLYLILNCINWALVTLMYHKKLRIMQYIKRFLLINGLWFLLILIITFLLRKFIAQLAIGSNPAIIIILSICSTILGYFIFISYPLIVQNKVIDVLKKTFKNGITRFPRIGLMYAYAVLALLILDIFLKFAGSLSPVLMFIAGIVLVLPLFAFIRLFITVVISRLE